MLRRIRPGAAALALLLICTACTTAAGATPTEILITLADTAVTVDGKAPSSEFTLTTASKRFPGVAAAGDSTLSAPGAAAGADLATQTLSPT